MHRNLIVSNALEQCGSRWQENPNMSAQDHEEGIRDEIIDQTIAACLPLLERTLESTHFNLVKHTLVAHFGVSLPANDAEDAAKT